MQCRECNGNVVSENLVPVCEKGTDCYFDESDLKDNWFVCKDCLSQVDEDSRFGECEICSEDVAYFMQDLVPNECGFTCREHSGEGPIDREEEEGWDDIIEKLNKD